MCFCAVSDSDTNRDGSTVRGDPGRASPRPLIGAALAAV